MTAYLLVKWLHILSATVLFGTGLGTALHIWLTHRRGDMRAIASTLQNVVWVDWVFTGTSGIVQPVTGFLMVRMAGFDPLAPWLVASYALYVLAFACWAPVVWLQIKCRDMAIEAVKSGSTLPERYHRYMRRWFWLGWPAFIALLGVFWLKCSRIFPTVGCAA
jgi:uncharacterized membrane protein